MQGCQKVDHIYQVVKRFQFLPSRFGQGEKEVIASGINNIPAINPTRA